jgi:hypothetical protein
LGNNLAIGQKFSNAFTGFCVAYDAMHSLNLSTTIGVVFRLHDLSQQLKCRQVEHLPQREMNGLPVLIGSIQAHQSVAKESADTKANLICNDLLLQGHVGNNSACLGFGQRQIHTNQNSMLTITRANSSYLDLITTTRNKIEAVYASGDKKHAGNDGLGVVQAPARFGFHDSRVAAVDNRSPRLEQRRLNNIASPLRNKLANATFCQLLLASGIKNRAHRKGELVAKATIQAGQGTVKRGHDVLNGRPIHHLHVLIQRRANCIWRGAPSQRENTGQTYR